MPCHFPETSPEFSSVTLWRPFRSTRMPSASSDATDPEFSSVKSSAFVAAAAMRA